MGNRSCNHVLGFYVQYNTLYNIYRRFLFDGNSAVRQNKTENDKKKKKTK